MKSTFDIENLFNASTILVLVNNNYLPTWLLPSDAVPGGSSSLAFNSTSD